MSTFWLSCHASYRCRDSGACCWSGWDIPLDAGRVATIGRLMDLDGYGEWEQEMVRVLTTVEPSEALDFLEKRAREKARLPLSASSREKWTGPFSLFAKARAAVPAPYSWPEEVEGGWERVDEEWAASAPVIGRYLAAHAFASWMAYQGHGVRAQVMSLRQALAVLRVETMRHGRLLDGIRQAICCSAISPIGRRWRTAFPRSGRTRRATTTIARRRIFCNAAGDNRAGAADRSRRD